MPHYKDQNNKLYYLDNTEDETKYLPAGYVEISDAEAESIRASSIDHVAEKSAMLEIGRSMRETVINRLDGISGRSQRAGDTVTSAACDAAIVELLAITAWPDVVSATDGPSTKAAFLARYNQIAAELATASEYAYTAFRGQDL